MSRFAPVMLIVASLFWINAECPSSMPMSDGGGGLGSVDQLTGPRLLTTSDRDGRAAILTFRRDATLTGDAAPAMVLTGPATDLTQPKGLAVNNAGQLLVVHEVFNPMRADFDAHINVYADATRLNGDQAPIRKVTITGLFNDAVGDVVFDFDNEILFVALGQRSTGGAGPVLAFLNTDSDSFNGPRAADFEFSPNNGEVYHMFADPGNGLFVATDTGASICTGVDSAAASCNMLTVGEGSLGVARNSAGDFFALTIDGNDRRFRRADGGPIADGGSESDFDMDILIPEMIGGVFAYPSELAVDSSDTAYISSSSQRLFIYENASTRTEKSEVMPDRVVGGNTAGLGGNLAGDGKLLLLN